MTFARRESPEEQRARNEARKAANITALMTPSREECRGTYQGGTTAAAPKKPMAAGTRRDEMAHKAALAALGCMACRRLFPHLPPGPVELHHLRSGGWGKGDYLTLIPLCVEHHRGDTGVHGMGTKGFPKRYGFDQADLLMDALGLLGGVTA